jgi:hypothetical protein
MNTKPTSEFEKAASETRRRGLLGDFWDFLRQNKKWWLLPIVLMLFLLGLLIFMSGSALAPFIYTLF